jgi:ABC-2 type transport system permease protein
MNPPASTLHDFDQPISSPAVSFPTRPFYWSVRRELWEFRSIYIAPLAVAAVYLFGFMISLIHLPARISALDPSRQQEALQQPYDFVALAIMGTTFLIALFYSVEAFQGERRDRSILFWKSLPVSDLTTVLSKAAIPIVIIPLLTVAVTLVTQWMMFLVSSAVLAGSGLGVGTLTSNVPLGQMQLGLMFHLIAIHGLWYAPIFGWLLLVSAWARRVAFLWAALPPLAIVFVERISFGTSYFGQLLGERIAGGSRSAVLSSPGGMPVHLDHFHLGEFLASPGLWIGLALTAAFLFAAARMRRDRGPV